jgi:hypothetical protein
MDRINNYKPPRCARHREANADTLNPDTLNLPWAANVWYSIKKHWVLELQRLIRAKRSLRACLRIQDPCSSSHEAQIFGNAPGSIEEGLATSAPTIIKTVPEHGSPMQQGALDLLPLRRIARARLCDRLARESRPAGRAADRRGVFAPKACSVPRD